MDDTIAPAPVAAEASSVDTPTPVSEPTTSVSDAPAEPVAQDSTPVETTAVEPAADEPAPEQMQPERQPSRAERRIQQLTGQLKEVTAQSQANSLLPPLPPQTPISQLLQGQDSIDPQELDRIVESREQAARGFNNLEVQQLRHELVQQRAVDEVEKDAAVLPAQYQELSTDSPVRESLEARIENEYKRLAVRPNPLNPNLTMIDPTVRLADVARDVIETYRLGAEQGKAQTSAALATHADNSAITPTSDTTPEKSFDDMSLSEQEAYLRAKGHDV